MGVFGRQFLVISLEGIGRGHRPCEYSKVCGTVMGWGLKSGESCGVGGSMEEI